MPQGPGTETPHKPIPKLTVDDRAIFKDIIKHLFHFILTKQLDSEDTYTMVDKILEEWVSISKEKNTVVKKVMTEYASKKYGEPIDVLDILVENINGHLDIQIEEIAEETKSEVKKYLEELETKG